MLSINTCIWSAGALLAAFGSGWRLALQRVPPSPDMAASPLQPLLVTAARVPGAAAEPSGQDAVDAGSNAAQSGGAGSGAAPAVELGFAAAGVAGPASAQMAAIERVWSLFAVSMTVIY